MLATLSFTMLSKELLLLPFSAFELVSEFAQAGSVRHNIIEITVAGNFFIVSFSFLSIIKAFMV